MRSAMLLIASLFLISFGAITIYAAVDRGFTILSALSIVIVLMMGIGILGALWQVTHPW